MYCVIICNLERTYIMFTSKYADTTKCAFAEQSFMILTIFSRAQLIKNDGNKYLLKKGQVMQVIFISTVVLYILKSLYIQTKMPQIEIYKLCLRYLNIDVYDIHYMMHIITCPF